MFLDVINGLMAERGINKSTLSKESGIPYTTIDGWYKKGYNNVGLATLRKLCKYFNVSLDYLMEQETSLSANEQKLVDKYRLLDSHGKEVVKNLLEAECRRIEELKKLALENERPQTRFIDFYNLPVSAGTGIEITDESADMIEVPVDDTTLRADYVLRVSGKSMEPIYEDGDLILIQSMPTVDIGDLGIFIINNEAFFKKRGKTELISLNSKFPNVRLNEFDRVDCKGKVLGKINNGR